MPLPAWAQLYEYEGGRRRKTERVLLAAALWLEASYAEKADEILQALDHGGVTDELVTWAEAVIAQAKGGE